MRLRCHCDGNWLFLVHLYVDLYCVYLYWLCIIIIHSQVPLSCYVVYDTAINMMNVLRRCCWAKIVACVHLMFSLCVNIIKTFVLIYNALKSDNIHIIGLVLTEKKLQILLCQMYRPLRHQNTDNVFQKYTLFRCCWYDGSITAFANGRFDSKIMISTYQRHWIHWQNLMLKFSTRDVYIRMRIRLLNFDNMKAAKW